MSRQIYGTVPRQRKMEQTQLTEIMVTSTDGNVRLLHGFMLSDGLGRRLIMYWHTTEPR